MPECNGATDCEVHPHIQGKHPAAPIEVRYRDGTTATVDYSSEWECAEAEWAKFESSPDGRAWLDAIDTAMHGRA